MLAIEISRAQGQVHISDWKDALREKRWAVLMDRDSDWTIVDTAGTEAEAVNKACFWEGVVSGHFEN